MIDEDLYQQAADELNTNQRRPHLWARACALASDDHDEARFLYTNLRVEELLAERKNAANIPKSDNTLDADATLGLTPLDDTIADGDIPSSVSSPSGIDAPGVGSSDLRLEPLEEDTFSEPDSNTVLDRLPPDPDADLMADYVPEKHDVFDDTYTDAELGEPAFQKELASFKAEQADNNSLEDLLDEATTSLADPSQDNIDLSVTSEDELHKDTAELIDNIDLTRPSDDQLLQGSIEEPISENTMLSVSGVEVPLTVDGDPSDIDNADYTLEQPGDLTQSNLDVLEAHTNELDSMLENTKYDPAQATEPEDDLDWLDAEIDSDDTIDGPRTPREPLIFEDDPLTSELTRQADDLDLGKTSDETADFSQQIAEQLAKDDSFPTPAYEDEQASFGHASEHIESTLPGTDQVVPEHIDSTLPENDQFVSEYTDSALSHDDQVVSEQADSALSGTDELSDHIESGHDASESDALPVAAAIAATSALAVSAPDLSSPRQHHSTSINEREHHDTGIEHTLPLDLTPGRKGKKYSIYRRDQQAQAVKNGVSWSAMILTLPYLLYRQLFGTALAYITLWIVAIGGLVLSGLAWIDAGSEVTPLIQACTVGFGLLAFIGLLYLPFRYGNAWRADKLENRGFDLVAHAKAKNPGRAIARARRHSALGSQ